MYLRLQLLLGNSDSVTINYIAPVAIPDLGPDLSLCPGEQLVLLPIQVFPFYGRMEVLLILC
jgi:hypothetical protein